ncbi:MAG: hypothetical protein V1733_09395 [bacterium]
MGTEEHDNRFNRIFREKFGSFESEPPAEAWEAIRKKLPVGIPSAGQGAGWADWLGRLWPKHKLYPALAVLALLLVVVLIWVSRKETHNLSGTAYVEGKALCRGTAFLFRVHDTHRPLDSVSFVGKTEVDTSGRFSFRRLPSAKYLIRILTPPDGGYRPRFQFGYSGDQLCWDMSELISLVGDLENYIVNIPELIPRQ